MAKLYFRYGTMDSAKTLNLLAVAHNYRKQGKRVVLAKPALDDRFGGAEALAAIEGHVLAKASITGRYTLNPTISL